MCTQQDVYGTCTELRILFIGDMLILKDHSFRSQISFFIYGINWKEVGRC